MESVVENCQKEQQQNNVELPFILNFLEKNEGAVGFTTTGIYDNPDCSDSD